MKKSSFLSYLTSRNKLSFKNIISGEEYWSIFVNRVQTMGFVILLFCLMLLGAIAISMYTPLFDMLPGNPGSKQRELLISNIKKLDSLEQEVDSWERYNSNLLAILDGDISSSTLMDTITKDMLRIDVASKSELDSLLRLKHQNDAELYVGENIVNKNKEYAFDIISPVSGLIVERYSSKDGIYGLTFTPSPATPILAVMNGTVTLNSWSPKDGYVIVMQHANNMISIYKNMATTLKSVGEYVKAGTPIASSKGVDTGVIPSFCFELWKNGTPVNPQDYILF